MDVSVGFAPKPVGMTPFPPTYKLVKLYTFEYVSATCVLGSRL